MRQLTAGSLFSGIGGIDLAFALAGFNILFQVEIDDFCRKVLAKHGPTYWQHSALHTDVRGVGRHNLPSVDVLFGGFPCQDISNAGRRAGIVHGEKSGLWREFKRLIGELRPSVVFLENVPTITVARRGGIEVITDLAQMGYDARWGIVSARDAGAPHLRERWFCVAYPNGQRHNGSAAAKELQRNEERHDQSHLGRGLSLSSALVSNGEVGVMEYAHGKHGSPVGAMPVGGHAGFVGGRFGPDESFSVDNTHGERQQEGDFARDGGSSLVGGQDVGSRIETRGTAHQSSMGRATHGLSRRMDGHQLMSHQWPVSPHHAQHEAEAPRMAPGDEHTIDRIRALGNAVVPQCIYPQAVLIAELLASLS